MTPLYLYGGKTRLAAALYDAAVRSGRTTRVLSGQPSEDASLRAAYPPGAVVETVDGSTIGPIDIVVCALGLTHPSRPDVSLHASVLVDELRRLVAVVRAHGGTVHLIVVSTVIALVAPRDRAYYAGFKNLSEAVAADALRTVTDPKCSVLYPGRLVDRRGSAGLSSWIATPRSTLARRVLTLCASGRQSSCIVGMDARLWLLASVLRVLAIALAPRFRDMPLRLRDGLPHE